MTRRALVIGCQTGVLNGVLNDVARMTAMLSSHGFDVHSITQRDATREGILAAFDSLIAHTRPDDAVVVYYSGHGASVRNPDYLRAAREGRVVPANIRMIVPFDKPEGSDKDFRAVLSYELSAFFWQLTGVTRNVTAIFDCCYSGKMARGHETRGGGTPKCLLNPSTHGLEATLRHLDGTGRLLDAANPEGNPDTVRLVASRPDEIAIEYKNAAGEDAGVFTDALLAVLAETGDRDDVTWKDVGALARKRVLEAPSDQHPDVEGAADRLLFRIETR